MIDLWKRKNIPSERIQINTERFAPARIRFDTSRTVIHGTHDYQCDLMQISQFSRYTDGYKYVLVLINAYTKYVRLYPLKNKSKESLYHAFRQLVKTIPSNRRIRYLQSDKGTEFFNWLMDDFYKKHAIVHYNTHSFLKASIVERVIRTLRNMINLNMQVTGDKNWVNYLDSVAQTYNNKKHRIIGVTPQEAEISGVTPDISKRIENIGNRLHKIPMEKYKVGDIVRISKQKRLFEKETTTSNWTNEQFKIIKINSKEYPVRYYLVDYLNDPVRGYFTQYEISKVKYPGVYLIDKVIKCEKNKCLVKYLGFDDSHNTWVDKKEVLM